MRFTVASRVHVWPGAAASSWLAARAMLVLTGVTQSAETGRRATSPTSRWSRRMGGRCCSTTT